MGGSNERRAATRRPAWTELTEAERSALDWLRKHGESAPTRLAAEALAVLDRLLDHAFECDGADCALCGEGRQHYLHTDREPEHQEDDDGRE